MSKAQYQYEYFFRNPLKEEIMYEYEQGVTGARDQKEKAGVQDQQGGIDALYQEMNDLLDKAKSYEGTNLISAQMFRVEFLMLDGEKGYKIYYGLFLPAELESRMRQDLNEMILEQEKTPVSPSKTPYQPELKEFELRMSQRIAGHKIENDPTKAFDGFFLIECGKLKDFLEYKPKQLPAAAVDAAGLKKTGAPKDGVSTAVRRFLLTSGEIDSFELLKFLFGYGSNPTLSDAYAHNREIARSYNTKDGIIEFSNQCKSQAFKMWKEKAPKDEKEQKIFNQYSEIVELKVSPQDFDGGFEEYRQAMAHLLTDRGLTIELRDIVVAKKSHKAARLASSAAPKAAAEEKTLDDKIKEFVDFALKGKDGKTNEPKMLLSYFWGGAAAISNDIEINKRYAELKGDGQSMMVYVSSKVKSVLLKKWMETDSMEDQQALAKYSSLIALQESIIRIEGYKKLQSWMLNIIAGNSSHIGRHVASFLIENKLTSNEWRHEVDIEMGLRAQRAVATAAPAHFAALSQPASASAPAPTMAMASPPATGDSFVAAEDDARHQGAPETAEDLIKTIAEKAVKNQVIILKDGLRDDYQFAIKDSEKKRGAKKLSFSKGRIELTIYHFEEGAYGAHNEYRFKTPIFRSVSEEEKGTFLSGLVKALNGLEPLVVGDNKGDSLRSAQPLDQESVQKPSHVFATSSGIRFGDDLRGVSSRGASSRGDSSTRA